MKEQTDYILWLPSWYPTEITPTNGDFIQRHAQAVSQFTNVFVLHIIRDKLGIVTKDIQLTEKQEGNLKETIIYYHSRSSSIDLLDSFLSYQKYSGVYKKYLGEYFQNHGLPSLVHVHIAFKAGMIARWIKKNRGIRYLLTEQWTAYLEDASPNLRNLSLSSQYFINKIITEASLIMPVSEYLANAIRRKWPFVDCEVVPNVVNTQIFYPQEKLLNSQLKLIHVSTLSYQKDPETLFEAIRIVKENKVDILLELVGPVSENIISLINKKEIAELIILRGEMPQETLAELIRASDALILYSRYETFGCVIIEANACGIPVLVPDTKLMNEIVENEVNGIIVPANNYQKLAEAIMNFDLNKQNFNSEKIVESTQKYSYENVGKLIKEIYKRYLN